MAASFAFIGILVMLDVLVFVNYLAVKRIRAWTDQSEEQQQLGADGGSFATMLRNFSARLGPRNTSNVSVTEYCQAIFMDVVHREQSSVHTFEKWRDLPYNCGKWSTAILVFLSLFFLSAKVLDHDTITSGLQTSSADFCRATDFSSKVDSFKSEMNTEANLDLSRKQFNWTEGFYDALVTDTSLYGTDGFECPSMDGLSGSMSDWTSTNQSFFPGYCPAVKKAEIEYSKQASCTRRKCKCANLFGIPTLTACWIAKMCVDVPCSEFTNDQEAELEGYYSESEELRAEEENQANTTTAYPSLSDTASMAAASTIQKILYQVDVASVAYALYSVLVLFFPSPLLMFRLPYGYYVRRYIFGIHKPTFICFVIALWWGIEYFRPIWYNPEIRLYLRMLRIGDPCLFDTDFIKAKLSVIKEICEELVTMEDQFATSTLAINRISADVGFFANSCNCSFPNQNLIQFQTPSYIFLAQAEELGYVREMEGLCEPPYCNRIFLPAKDISFVGETSMCSDTTLAWQYLFKAPGEGIETNWWQIWISTGILAQLLIKVVVTNFCIALYRLADPLSSCGGRFEWPPGHLFRGDDQTNTDSIASSNGGMPLTMATKLRSRKTKCLRIIASKWTIFWGTLTNLCLLNLALASIDDASVSMAGSGLVFFICSTVAAASIFGLLHLYRVLQHRGVKDDMNYEDYLEPEDEVKPYAKLGPNDSTRAPPLLRDEPQLV